MHTQLKNAMRAAGITVSEGDTLAQSDLQPARDFLYFRGVTLRGDEFDLYEEGPEDSDVNAAQDPTTPPPAAPGGPQGAEPDPGPGGDQEVTNAEVTPEEPEASEEEPGTTEDSARGDQE